jgi:protein-tyrosine kinase
MEKLQKALQKAREQRDSSVGSPPGAIDAGHRRGHSRDAMPTVEEASDTDALWRALKPFETESRTLEKNRIVTGSVGALGNSFDILRTKVLLTMQKNGWKRLAVTSPTMGCGKTTTACNLAIGAARNTDMRTILFEFDLRRPAIASTLGLEVEHDVSRMLSGEVDFSEQVLRFKSNVAIAAARTSSKDPTTILISKAVKSTLAHIEAVYEPDIMIFDLPPLLVSDDTTAVLKDMDCALMVAKANVTTVAQIDRCEREIAEQTNMLGVVLNHCRDTDDNYDYYE